MWWIFSYVAYFDFSFQFSKTTLFLQSLGVFSWENRFINRVILGMGSGKERRRYNIVVCHWLSPYPEWPLTKNSIPPMMNHRYVTRINIRPFNIFRKVLCQQLLILGQIYFNGWQIRATVRHYETWLYTCIKRFNLKKSVYLHRFVQNSHTFWKIIEIHLFQDHGKIIEFQEKTFEICTNEKIMEKSLHFLVQSFMETSLNSEIDLALTNYICR